MAGQASTDFETTPAPPRFPLAQVAFFAACVGMAAWLWATYSWCVRVTPADLRAPDAWERLGGRYVEVTGQPTYVWRGGAEDVSFGILDPDVLLDPDCQGGDGLDLVAWVRPLKRPPPPRETEKSTWSPGQIRLLLPLLSSETYRGRVILTDVPDEWGAFVVSRPAVDERMGRFGGEFFAGAAVAAMGALVLALYLREWYVGRCAAGRDGTRAPRPPDRVA
ncbi:MAG: hypothetical protein ACYTKD_23360 [Planctomycetota bacterium]|jgi:hypothetical protein